MKKIFLLFFVSQLLVTGQQTPGSGQYESILIENAIIHIGDGTVIKMGYVGFKDGKIKYVGGIKPENKYDKSINTNGAHLYPGLIALNSTLGLAEIDAVRATRDYDEIGPFLPHISSSIAYNAESKVVESMRMNGVLIAQTTPRGGIISGKSSIMQLDAWNWEDALIFKNVGIHLNWPTPYSYKRSSNGERTIEKNKNYIKRVKKIKDFFKSSKSYLPNPKPINLEYEAMRNIFNGNEIIFLHANSSKQIQDGILFLSSLKIKKIVLVGGIYSYKQKDLLIKNKIPIVLKHPHNLPSFVDEDPKIRFRNAKKLVDAGLLVSIDVSGSMERMNSRNLPFYAGSFSAYGVDKENALRMITLNAAKILGISENYGSIKVDKSATFFISKGDALDMRSNILEYAFIDGRKVSLESHQTILWKRYLQKSRNNKNKS
tara:strand:- start:57 stop:1349 length:1293 start_codon:yes stop_codon:yes gene_type:complete